MKLDIITPEKIIYSADAQVITIPGTEGEFGILEGHAPFISTIRPGVIVIEGAGSTKKLAVMSGIAEVVPERCIILAENVVDCADLTAAYAESKMEQATEEAQNAQTDTEKKAAEIKRQFAEVLTKNTA